MSPPIPITYESVLSLIRENSQETRREIQETSRLIKEQGAEFDRLMKEQAAEFDRRAAEFDRRAVDFDKRVQKTELQIERTSKEVGNLGNSVGRLVEHMLGERIIEKFQALGYAVTHPVRRNCSFSNTKLGIEGEFDLTLVDTDTVILIEVKMTLDKADVRHHIEQIEKYRQHIESVGFVQPPFTHLLPTTRFIGAVAGAVVEKSAIEYAQENGLYTITQSGETVEILPTPDGFIPKVW